jgi:UDP-N-acetylglucosamine--N-acetylmuramyl-(pentapeptide) pyrophosphoryl-undecaprenol N-acetylglucosamine transferase
LEQLNLSPSKQTILVFGGSQGALIINRLLQDTAERLADLRDRIQFIHLTGHEDNDEIISAYAKAGIQASVRQVEPHIERCYLASDLVICRGGASSICELALFGKPSILIPLPTAAEGHQLINAQMLAEKNCAVALVQEDASIQVLYDMFQDWQKNPAKWQGYGENIKLYARPNAAMDMARLVASVLPAELRQKLQG